MLRSLLRNTGLSVLFVGFFFLHGVNEYPGLIPYSVLFALLLKYILIAVGITLFSFVLFRHADRAFLFSLLLLTFYFFFGAIHDFIKATVPEGFLRSYRFFLPLLAAIILGVFLVLKFRKPAAVKTSGYFRYLLFILLLIEVVIAGYHFWIPADQGMIGKTRFPELQPVQTKTEDEPDIFFIVLDEYASGKSLKQEFNFDNSALDSTLRANHFFISDDSRSNYNVTPFSLASTFSLNYLEETPPQTLLTSRKFVEAMETMKNSGLTSFFADRYYALKNYGCFEIGHTKLETSPFFIYAYPKLLDDRTAWPRLKREIGWQFTVKDPFTGKFRIPDNYRQSKAIHTGRNKDNWSALTRELKLESATPRFVIAHILLPHEPFYFKADGTEVNDTLLVKGEVDERKGYIDQVQYTNRLLAGIMPFITPKGKRPRVVIIEGDHGFRSFGGGANASKEFPNLNAWYFSDGDYSMLYNGISPVNTFRVVLNKYFTQHLPLLKDSSVYIINPSGSLEK